MNAMLQTVRGLGGVRIAALAGVGAVLLVFFAFLSFRLASPVLSPLYTNLSMEDAAQMVVELEALEATYQVSPDGKSVMVPSGDVSRLRLALAQKGLPSQGSIVGYEIFDKSDSLGTSNFVHNVNLIRALEGELARTIASFESISSARVHLVIPKRQLFSRERVEPSASVVLNLRKRGMPSKDEVAAVTHLVSTAVMGLKPSNITIVDNTGKLLAKGGDPEQEEGMVSASSNDFKTTYEIRLKRTIEDLLEQSVGIGKVKAQVSAEIDFDRIVTNSEVYDPDGQVARSVQTTEAIEKSSETEGSGNVSVSENLPGADSASAGAAGEQSSVERVNETTNYEISRTIKNHIKETGTVKKLSIAVLVDGQYRTVEPTEEDGEPTQEYVPRSDEELAQLRSLVESSVGFDPDRGDNISIINMQFSRDVDGMNADESPFEWLKRDLGSIVKTLVIGVVAVLAILLVIRPMVNRAFEVSPGGEDSGNVAGLITGDANLLEAEDESIDVDDIQNKVSESSSKKVTEIVDNNPEETLMVIRGWLSQKT